MTLEDYFVASKRHGRSVLVSLAPLPAMLVCMVSYMPFLESVRSTTSIKYGEVAAPLVAVAPVIVLFAAGIGMVALLLNRFASKYDVLCEHCGRSIAVPKMIVVASKHCPHCGKQVIAES